MQSSQDEIFMTRALELAGNGLGSVSPNPMVGCVIVHDNKIIGEGWHKAPGQPHAEVNAVNDTIDRTLLSESTVYVTLEPCSHFGKTPPCADLLIRERVKRVVIASLDTNPLVSGKGIARLRDAGMEVITGVLDRRGRELNKRFFTFIEKKRPYIILKWAETSDGFIARENFDSKWISNESSRKLVHKWRSEEDAILVGYNTALHDNPQLNVRDWQGKQPLRIVIDPNLKLPQSLNLFDKSQKTICFNFVKNDQIDNLEWIKVSDKTFHAEMFSCLQERAIQSLIVEGGSRTLQSFIDNNTWDEARVFVSPEKFGSGIKRPILPAKPVERTDVNGDVLKIYRNQH